ERDRDTTGNGTLDERLYDTQDADWNVTALFDTSGNIQERFVLEPYGKVNYYDGDWNVRSASNAGWQYTFQGLRFNGLVGLFDNRLRWYSPTLQVFVSQDPLSFVNGYTNFYERGGNNPLNTLDESGYQDRKEFDAEWEEKAGLSQAIKKKTLEPIEGVNG